MSKLKNPAIKLFGKTISLPPNQIAASVHHLHHEQQSSSSALTENKSTSGEDFLVGIQIFDPMNLTEEESVELETTSTGSETLKTPVASRDTLSPNDTRREEETESSSSIETMMKKPENILPCPRCSSMDTKFCYYNNYNVKQPRHFCRSCQRFWTAGGTMRNMAVGSGRRKNKGNCPSSPDLTKRPEFFPSAQGYGPRISCLSGNPWPSHWNAVQFSSPASQDATFPSSFAVNFYPTNPYCISAIPGTWMPAPSPSPKQSVINRNPASPLGKRHIDGSLLQSDINNADPDVESGAQRYVKPNKALKIDDINDAATLSIRSSMGISDSNEGSFMRSSHFKAFYPILHGKNHIADNSLILQANPAAFSRSMNFRELS